MILNSNRFHGDLMGLKYVKNKTQKITSKIERTIHGFSIETTAIATWEQRCPIPGAQVFVNDPRWKEIVTPTQHQMVVGRRKINFCAYFNENWSDNLNPISPVRTERRDQIEPESVSSGIEEVVVPAEGLPDVGLPNLDGNNHGGDDPDNNGGDAPGGGVPDNNGGGVPDNNGGGVPENNNGGQERMAQ